MFSIFITFYSLLSHAVAAVADDEVAFAQNEYDSDANKLKNSINVGKFLIEIAFHFFGYNFVCFLKHNINVIKRDDGICEKIFTSNKWKKKFSVGLFRNDYGMSWKKENCWKLIFSWDVSGISTYVND